MKRKYAVAVLLGRILFDGSNTRLEMHHSSFECFNPDEASGLGIAKAMAASPGFLMIMVNVIDVS